MQKLAQIHFEIPASQKKLIHKLAKNKGISNSTYYHEMINKQIINSEAILADQKLGKFIHSSKLPKIYNQKEFEEWLNLQY